MEVKKLICIGCPLGCEMRVEIEAAEIVRVIGNTCKRGEKYAIDECTAPVRVLTTSIPVEGGKILMVSVKTKKGLPKDKMTAGMKELSQIRLKAPVRTGDIVAANIAGTQIDVVATRTVMQGKEEILK